MCTYKTMINSFDILHSKILIVDDQEASLILLEKILRSAGYVSISSLMDPAKVCELHRKNSYDLILLDLKMPGKDGYQVREELKGIESEGYLPVIVIAAQPNHPLRAFKSAAKDFVSKPFKVAEVLVRVNNMLEVRLLNKALYKSNDVLEQKVLGRTEEPQERYRETIFTMTRAVEYKDEGSGAPVRRMNLYCRELARMLPC